MVTLNSVYNPLMKKAVKIVGVLVVVGFIVLQFFGIDKTNPPVVQAETLEAVVAVPADISQILGRACNDCHTNTTIYPWYSNIQLDGFAVFFPGATKGFGDPEALRVV